MRPWYYCSDFWLHTGLNMTTSPAKLVCWIWLGFWPVYNSIWWTDGHPFHQRSQHASVPAPLRCEPRCWHVWSSVALLPRLCRQWERDVHSPTRGTESSQASASCLHFCCFINRWTSIPSTFPTLLVTVSAPLTCLKLKDSVEIGDKLFNSHERSKVTKVFSLVNKVLKLNFNSLCF